MAAFAPYLAYMEEQVGEVLDAVAQPAVVAALAPWLLAVITAYYCTTIIVEIALYKRMRPGRYDHADAFASFTVNLMSSVIEAVLGLFVPIVLYVLVYANLRLFDPGFAPWTWAAAFVVHELAYYWGHRAGHRVGLFWAFHQPHHSSEELNLSTASRGFLFGDPVGRILMLPAALLGVHPAVFGIVVTLKNMWGIFNHTQLVGKMGVLERWMATPANHRVHHARNPCYIDKNYSQVLLWDRLFGTWEPETEPPDFGLVVPQVTTNPLRIWLGGWMWLGRRIASAPTWADKLRYLYKPPEWTHDGCATWREDRQSARDFVAAE